MWGEGQYSTVFYRNTITGTLPEREPVKTIDLHMQGKLTNNIPSFIVHMTLN